MTTGFTIDDVRDTLTNDVSRFLGRIEMAARGVLERTELGMEVVPHTLPLFQLIADHGHALHGTTRLVSALSLASSAERMEQLALQGRSELDRALRHLSLARELASAMAGGATDMLAMLSLELDARPSEAQVIAESWRLRVEDVLFRGTTGLNLALEPANVNSSAAHAPPPATPAPPVTPAAERSLDSGWGDFDDAAASVASAPLGPSRVSDLELPASRSEGFSFASSQVESVSRAAIDAELAEVFGIEAQATFAVIDEKLAGLAAHPDDRGLLKTAERAFHTLKGAAATVGLAAVSERAAELQVHAEALMDAVTEPTADDVAALTRATAALRALAGLPSAPAATPPSARPAPPPARGLVPAFAPVGPDAMLDEIAAELEREARVAFDEAEHLIGRLRDADGDRDGEAELARQLRVVMHRLKGSAHVTGFLRLADAAAGIERLAEHPPLDAGRLAAEIAAAEALLAAPPTAAPAPATTSVGEARQAFGVELREVLEQASGLVPGLRAGDATARERLARMFHRLKGSALVADDDALATEASALHASLDTAAAAPGAAADELADRIVALVERTGGHTGAVAAQRIAVPVLPRELEPEFQQECADLLEALDRAALALESAARPHDVLDELMRNYHTLKGVVNALGLRPLGDQLHKIEDVLEQLRGRPVLPPLRTIVGLLLPCHGELRKQLRMVRLGYVELVPGRLEARIAQLLARGSRATASAASASGLGSALRRSRGSRGSEASDLGDAASEAPDRRNVRVPVERLEALMNLAGELVINRSRLLSRIDWLRGLQGDLGHSSRRVLELVEKFRDDHEFSNLARGAGPARPVRWTGFSELELDRYEDVNILARSLTEGSTDLQELFGQLAAGLGSLADDSDTLGTIVSGIQGEITRARMVPLDAVFSRLQLPVRDAAQREGREVQIETAGASVHLDKTIVDAMFQPMLHLVRNAVSHGIESRSERLAAGKPAHGTISLRARQELGQVVIEVADDGAGLDLERLRARGAAMGLIAADTPLDDPRVRDLVFAQGLSTHAQVDAVAGRGVGCDVVRRAVERLNGSVRVASVRRQRTVFVIVLPLTLAITRALLVRQGGDRFAVPLYFIERIVDAQELDIIESANQRRIDIDGTFVPIRGLGEFVQGVTAPEGPILLLQIGGQRLVVQVDEVLTQEEIVVKNLGTLLRGHPMFAGVTIRGTGEVVLILDVPGMADGVLGRQPEAAQGRPAAALVALDASATAAASIAVDEPAEAEAEAALDADPARPLRVLFVDDSVSVRKVAERALRSLGVDVTLAADGVDALDKLRSAHVDIVFTDLEMPRMHGYELIRELRFLPAYHALPIVVVTSRSGKKHRDEAHAVGASEYLTKPFTPRSLAAALLKFGGKRAHSPALIEAAGGAGS